LSLYFRMYLISKCDVNNMKHDRVLKKKCIAANKNSNNFRRFKEFELSHN